MFKEAFNTVVSWFRNPKRPTTAPSPEAEASVKNTTATRRAAQRQRDSERMIHLSKSIPEDVNTALLLGMPQFIPTIMRKTKGHGVTYNVGRNAAKREADSFLGRKARGFFMQEKAA